MDIGQGFRQQARLSNMTAPVQAGVSLQPQMTSSQQRPFTINTAHPQAATQMFSPESSPVKAHDATVMTRGPCLVQVPTSWSRKSRCTSTHFWVRREEQGMEAYVMLDTGDACSGLLLSVSSVCDWRSHSCHMDQLCDWRLQERQVRKLRLQPLKQTTVVEGFAGGSMAVSCTTPFL